ncbi:MAG: antitoxin Xre/MbcA/ParS toxin-binding domain-containing protein [Chthoniobacterales bacterium]
MGTTALRKQSATVSLQAQIERIRAGLSFRAVQNLQKAFDFPLETVAAVLGISRATLHRRKTQGRIDRREAERVVRYQRLLERAREVFGHPDAARKWLKHPQQGLGGAVPIDFAKTELGAREVENLLGRIEYGVYS